MTSRIKEADGNHASSPKNQLKAAAATGGGFGYTPIPTPSPPRILSPLVDLQEVHNISDQLEMYGGNDSDDDTCCSDSSAYDLGRSSHETSVHHGTATPTQMVVNIFISFVGAGLLGLPYAFSRSGWLLGTFCLATVSIGNVYSMLLLVKCRKRLESYGCRRRIKGYGDLGREILGPKGEMLVNVCLVVSQAGFAIAYLIFIAANVQKITSGSTGRATVVFGCVPLLSILIQFRDMKTLSPFSTVADIANLLGLTSVFIQDFKYNTHSDNVKGVDFAGLVYVTSVCMYSLEGAGLILPLENSCANREDFPRILKQTLLGITLLMTFFGTCGYVAFADETASPISLNLKGETATFVQMALCLALYFTYPIMMFPVSDVLENLFLSDLHKPPRTYGPSRLLRICIVLLTATIAYTTPNFGHFLELVGASICTLLGFILPCIFHMQVFGRAESTKWERILHVCIIVIGIYFGVVGTVDAIGKLSNNEE
ncbi:hypothetical protein ACHAWU_005801 [Discostella pseudostelligera]|uniref:Amino acid transporter transmembrane domain-containing protein n=1 Tax=Discostella pseudostelligera TaxID=259834 RepID=A0ABD3MFP0_9STRA